MSKTEIRNNQIYTCKELIRSKISDRIEGVHLECDKFKYEYFFASPSETSQFVKLYKFLHEDQRKLQRCIDKNKFKWKQ